MRSLLMFLLPLTPLAMVGKTTASMTTVLFTPLAMAHMVSEKDLSIDNAQIGWVQELNEGLKTKKVE